MAKPTFNSGVAISKIDGGFHLRWNSATNATKYELYRSTSSSSWGTRIYSGGNLTHDDKGLSNGTKYYYRAKACNSAGCVDGSQDSGEYEVAVGGSKPTMVIKSFSSEVNSFVTSKVEYRDDKDLTKVSYKIYQYGNTGGNHLLYKLITLGGTEKLYTKDWNIDTSSLADGKYEIMFFVSDGESGVQSVTKVFTKKSTVSSSRETIKITNPPSSSTHKDSFNISVEGKSELGIRVFSMKIYNGSGNEITNMYQTKDESGDKTETHTWSVNVSSLADGAYKLMLFATDRDTSNGGVVDVSYNFTKTSDAQPSPNDYAPTISKHSSPITEIDTNKEIVLKFSADDKDGNLGKVAVLWGDNGYDESNAVDCEPYYDIYYVCKHTYNKAGKYFWIAKAYDKGNPSLESEKITGEIDVTGEDTSEIIIDDITPLVAKVNIEQIFTVSGTNISYLSLFVQDNSCQDNGKNSDGHIFSCTFETVGDKTYEIKDKSDNVLKSGVIKVTEDKPIALDDFISFLNKDKLIKKMDLDSHSDYGLSRSDAIILIDRMRALSKSSIDEDMEEYYNPFADVPSDAEYLPSLMRLAYYKSNFDQTVIHKDELFEPMRHMLRQEFIKIAMNGFDIPKKSYDLASKYSDVDNIPQDHWVREYLETATYFDIIQGNSTTKDSAGKVKVLLEDKITIKEALIILRRIKDKFASNYSFTKSRYETPESLELSDLYYKSIGFEYEPKYYKPNAKPIDILSINQNQSGDYYILTVKSEIDNGNGASDYYWWSTDKGYFKEVKSSTNYKTVHFYPMSSKPNTDYNIKVYGGDNLGYVDSKSIVLDKDEFNYLESDRIVSTETIKSNLDDIKMESHLIANQLFTVDLTEISVKKTNVELGIDQVIVTMEDVDGKSYELFHGTPYNKKAKFIMGDYANLYGKNVTLKVELYSQAIRLSSPKEYNNILYIPQFTVRGKVYNSSLDYKVKTVNIGGKTISLNENSEFYYELSNNSEVKGLNVKVDGDVNNNIFEPIKIDLTYNNPRQFLLFIGDSKSTPELQTELVKLYIATFNRAPDADGLKYWLNEMRKNNWTTERVAKSFFDQVETKNRYPESFTNSQFIDAIYQNILNRTADSAGKEYWLGELENGRIKKDKFIIAIINGAKDEDKIFLSNRTDAGFYCAVDKEINDSQMVKDCVQGITKDPSSVDKVKLIIDENSRNIRVVKSKFDINSYKILDSNVDIEKHILINKDGILTIIWQNSKNEIFYGELNNKIQLSSKKKLSSSVDEKLISATDDEYGNLYYLTKSKSKIRIYKIDLNGFIVSKNINIQNLNYLSNAVLKYKLNKLSLIINFDNVRKPIALVLDIDSFDIIANYSLRFKNTANHILVTDKEDNFVGIDIKDKAINIFKYTDEKIEDKSIYHFNTDVILSNLIQTSSSDFIITFLDNFNSENIGFLKITHDFSTLLSDDNWIVKYSKNNENIKSLKSIKLINGDIALLWEKWRKDNYISTYFMIIDEYANVVENMTDIGEIRFSKNSKILTIDNKLYFISNNDNSKILELGEIKIK